jgi:hypothetical protein
MTLPRQIKQFFIGQMLEMFSDRTEYSFCGGVLRSIDLRVQCGLTAQLTIG